MKERKFRVRTKIEIADYRQLTKSVIKKANNSHGTYLSKCYSISVMNLASIKIIYDSQLFQYNKKKIGNSWSPLTFFSGGINLIFPLCTLNNCE